MTKYDSFVVNSISAWSKEARIYDMEHLTWGRVNFSLISEERQEEKIFNYWFTVDDVTINFRENVTPSTYKSK